MMVIFRQFIVRKHERGLLFKSGDFQKFLEPGTHRFFDPFWKMQVNLYDLSVPEFVHPLTDFLIKHYADLIAQHFTVVELNNQQIAIVYKNGRLADILPPASRTLYWKGIIDIIPHIIDIGEDFTISSTLAAVLLRTPDKLLLQRSRDAIYSKEVPEYHVGLLTIDGQCFNKLLPPGLHAYWQSNRRINIELWDTRLQEIEVSGQEILSKDKVSLRINLTASYFIQDVLRMTSSLAKPVEYLYKELQFGLRAAVGTRTLDELLENKHHLDEAVFTYIQGKTVGFGIEVKNVGIKDVILPGEMKTILNKVVEAEKAAQANLIKRREETAATRSLLNTAKVMEDNPTALRLKELEMLEKVTEKIGNISVFGGLEGLLKELVKIK